MFKNKTITLLITLVLLTIIAIPMASLPQANAHTPTWNIPSFGYLVTAPNPVGVGQRVSIMMWVDLPMPNAAVTNDIRRHDYKLTITKPDGATEVKTWAVIDDTTGVQWLSYVPDQVGDYNMKFDYAGQIYTWNSSTAERTWAGDTFLPATASKILTVQNEPLPEPVRSYPLPAEYWTRPIEGQNTDWFTISSNWLRGPYVGYGSSATEVTLDISGRYQADGIGPNSAHVMWSKPIQDGGVVGGSRVGNDGNTFYMGGSYNVRFAAGIVMYGRLFYQEPLGNSGGGGDYVAVDLRTGEELWRTNVTATGAPTFGYLYGFDSGNQHGVLPEGLLIASASVSGQGTVWRAYDPSTGLLTSMNITNVPFVNSGANTVGAKGEILCYAINNIGTTSNPNWRLTQWNSSKVFGGAAGNAVGTWYSGTVNASLPACYDWNISMPLINSGAWSINRYVIVNNLLLLQQGSLGTGPRDNGFGANITAVSLKPNQVGSIMWTKYYAPAPENVTRKIIAVDPEVGVFVTEDKETLRLTGFSLTDGSQVWTSKYAKADIDTLRTTGVAAYGKLYCAGFDGILYAYDLTDGSLVFTYGNGGSGNSTYAGLGTAYGEYPIFVDVVADGKVYLATTEHSPDSPWYKNSQYRCVNATTGEEIWTMMGWGTGMYAGGYDIVADGSFVFLNCYDMQIYTLGKGPSSITIDTPMTAMTLGSSMVIRGTVTDISAGTKQNAQAARFPNGVPAVSDSSQSAWMEYVYMQKPRPTDATGVPVTISVVDANGNYREIGTTTSDSDGFYSLQWTPDIEGKYTVYASFAGSESYWPSHAVSAFAVDSAAATPAPTEAPPSNLVTTTDLLIYLVAGVVAIIIAIAVVGMLLLRKRP
jgi:hypothetical protein